MARKARTKSHQLAKRPPFECIALLLQGGGALGAYQGGVYQALVEAGLQPDWIAGISIGAINAAIIAGNPPAHRVERLREFWEGITAPPLAFLSELMAHTVPKGDFLREMVNQANAGISLATGVPGFFAPRPAVPWLSAGGTPEAVSFYDTALLRTTLERLVDFDRINDGPMRFSVGAVNVRTGNFVYFDTTTHVIGPEHVMASGALPPGFPPVEIEGEHYWDGGLVSNTPLQWVLDSWPNQDTLAFQVDLWSSVGNLPRAMPEVLTRMKEVQFSSRTRASTDYFKRITRLRHAAADLIDKLPEELRNGTEAELLRTVAHRKLYNIVHLIYRAKNYEGHSKDYEFSRASMGDHWQAGYHDTVRSLRHPEVLTPNREEVVVTFDLLRDGRD